MSSENETIANEISGMEKYRSDFEVFKNTIGTFWTDPIHGKRKCPLQIGNGPSFTDCCVFADVNLLRALFGSKMVTEDTTRGPMSIVEQEVLLKRIVEMFSDE
jgi:hypothetical protein